MAKLKLSMKTTIFASAALLLSVMLLVSLAAPFVVHAATVRERYASYDTRTGETSYYDIQTEDSDGAEGGSDGYYDPTEH